MSDRFNPPLSPNEEAVAEKARPAKRLPILCLDFDGVLHSYQSGWQGAAIIPDPPVPGAIEFLHSAVERFHVAIFSSRSGQPGGIDAMRGWLMMHVMAAIDDRREAEHVLGLIQWPTEKPAAIVSIDDRAITFTGRWPSLDEIAGFTPWNKRPATAPAAPEPAAGGELERLKSALDDSQSLLATIHHIGADEAFWKAESLSKLIAEQIHSNRAVLDESTPTRADAGAEGRR